LFENIKIEEKEEINMCQSLIDLRNDGKKEGETIGIQKNLIENIRSLMETLNFNVEQSMDALKVPQSQREEIYEFFH
ncbi:MAG: hypothetical protein K2P09_02515, partial [Erysipelotrichales bacterium]|nr:hypothetical protein [Erysipelotrichales bacterium]